MKHGVCREWHQNGQLKEERDFENDKMTGRWREWHENGQLIWDSIQTDGWPYNGHQRAWNKDGRLQLSSDYKEGKLHGILYRCDDNGKETREYWWKGKQQKYDVDRADLMIDFLSNLGFEIKTPDRTVLEPKL